MACTAVQKEVVHATAWELCPSMLHMRGCTAQLLEVAYAYQALQYKKNRHCSGIQCEPQECTQGYSIDCNAWQSRDSAMVWLLKVTLRCWQVYELPFLAMLF